MLILPLPQPGAGRQDAFDTGRALRRESNPGRGSGLDGRGVRGAGPGHLCPPWGGNRRVHRALQRTVDQRQPDLRRGVLPDLRQRVLSQANVQKPHPPIWIGGHTGPGNPACGNSRRWLDAHRTASTGDPGARGVVRPHRPPTASDRSGRPRREGRRPNVQHRRAFQQLCGRVEARG